MVVSRHTANTLFRDVDILILQIIGPRFGEATVLAVANEYQQATDWHKRNPSGFRTKLP